MHYSCAQRDLMSHCWNKQNNDCGAESGTMMSTSNRWRCPNVGGWVAPRDECDRNAKRQTNNYKLCVLGNQDMATYTRGSGDSTSAAKIGVYGTIATALIGAAVTIIVQVINSDPVPIANNRRCRYHHRSGTDCTDRL